jgi:hypothetical protein
MIIDNNKETPADENKTSYKEKIIFFISGVCFYDVMVSLIDLIKHLSN